MQTPSPGVENSKALGGESLGRAERVQSHKARIGRTANRESCSVAGKGAKGGGRKQEDALCPPICQWEPSSQNPVAEERQQASGKKEENAFRQTVLDPWNKR